MWQISSGYWSNHFLTCRGYYRNPVRTYVTLFELISQHDLQDIVIQLLFTQINAFFSYKKILFNNFWFFSHFCKKNFEHKFSFNVLSEIGRLAKKVQHTYVFPVSRFNTSSLQNSNLLFCTKICNLLFKAKNMLIVVYTSSTPKHNKLYQTGRKPGQAFDV